MELIGKNTSLKKAIQSIKNIVSANSPAFYLLITGAVGTGKTAIIEDVLSSLSPSQKKDIIIIKNLELLPAEEQEAVLKKISAPGVSLIATAESKAIETALRKGSINKLLYQKISLIPIKLPLLSERLDDLEDFAKMFLTICAHKYHKELQGLSSGAIQKLKKYSFPGNLIELKIILEHACLLEDSEIIQEKNIVLPEYHSREDAFFSFKVSASFSEYKKEAIDKLEKTYLASLLQKHLGSVSGAAKEAGLLRTAFSRLLSKHNIKAAEYKVTRRDN